MKLLEVLNSIAGIISGTIAYIMFLDYRKDRRIEKRIKRRHRSKKRRH